MSYFANWTVVTSAFIVLAAGAARADELDDKRKQLMTGDELPLSAWTRELKSLAVGFRPKTVIDRDDESPKFVERVGKSLDGKVFKLTGKVKKLDWKDGVGNLHVDLAGLGDSGFLKVNFTIPFVVKLDKEEAKKIHQGQSFELRAVADFHAYQSGAVGAKHQAQQLARITTSGQTKSPWIGTFTTQVYEVKINGKEYPGYWAKD